MNLFRIIFLVMSGTTNAGAAYVSCQGYGGESRVLDTSIRAASGGRYSNGNVKQPGNPIENSSATQAAELISAVFYTFIGAALTGVVWKVIDWPAPFPIMKEIEQDQNLALAVLNGAALRIHV